MSRDHTAELLSVNRTRLLTADARVISEADQKQAARTGSEMVKKSLLAGRLIRRAIDHGQKF